VVVLGGRKVLRGGVAADNEELILRIVEEAADLLVARAAHIDGEQVVVASRHVHVLSVD